MAELFESSLLFSHQQLCYADILSPFETSRNSRNTNVYRGLMSDNNSHLFLSHSTSTRSLMKENAAKSFVRVWKVMEMCYHILVEEKRVTQRELFYMLLSSSSEYFTSQSQVNRTIQDVVALLHRSRYSLGIMSSTRGLIAGRLLLQEPDKEAVDCAVCGSSGYPISGDLSLLESLTVKTDARYIIVIEKHAIFQRLVEDSFFELVPSILITAKGYPDLATRFMLHKINKAFPNLPILALVDWNPAGLGILCTYKYGSIGMGLEAYRYACNVRWLGVRGDDLQLMPEEPMVPLKPKDKQIAKSLASLEILSVINGNRFMLHLQILFRLPWTYL